MVLPPSLISRQCKSCDAADTINEIELYDSTSVYQYMCSVHFFVLRGYRLRSRDKFEFLCSGRPLRLGVRQLKHFALPIGDGGVRHTIENRPDDDLWSASFRYFKPFTIASIAQSDDFSDGSRYRKVTWPLQIDHRPKKTCAWSCSKSD